MSASLHVRSFTVVDQWPQPHRTVIHGQTDIPACSISQSVVVITDSIGTMAFNLTS